VAQLFSRRREDDPLEQLTPREREVLELMAGGRSNAAIAEELVLSVGAVEKHIANILMKLRSRLRTATTGGCSRCSRTSSRSHL
jgi:DNA-binding NarL/FixJ family response regulator